MKKSIIITLCLLQTTVLFAQQKLNVHGKVNLIAKSKNIYLGNIKIPLQSDGTFEYTGEAPQAGVMWMNTDSSFMEPVWVEAGNYTLNCEETHNTYSRGINIKVNVMNGPQTAMIYNKFYRTIQDGSLNTHIVKGDKAATRNLQMQAYQEYMDNIFKQYPAIPCLPNMVYDISHYAGDEATEKYIARLSPEMQKNQIIVQMQTDINREEKLAKGVFDDFSMQTADGKPFTLSSLKNKKIILIDFWASDCAPCRAAHPKYVELYKKYADKGLEIVSISLDDKTEAWINAIHKDNIDAWVNVSDLKSWKSDLVKSFYINYIPFHLMLDGNRKILKVYEFQSPSEQDIIAALK